MKVSGRVEVKFYIFLTSVQGGDEWTASCPGQFTPSEKADITHWDGSESLPEL
jgi:hypothetical protein